MAKNGKQPPGDYEVGYGKPPKETQFKPGTTGNRKGRPKREQIVDRIFRRILGESISVRENGAGKSMSRWEAMIRSASNRAIQGDPRAFNSLVSIARSLGHLEPVADEKVTGGVLMIPAPLNIEEWKKMMAEQKAMREREGN